MIPQIFGTSSYSAKLQYRYVAYYRYCDLDYIRASIGHVQGFMHCIHSIMCIMHYTVARFIYLAFIYIHYSNSYFICKIMPAKRTQRNCIVTYFSKIVNIICKQKCNVRGFHIIFVTFLQIWSCVFGSLKRTPPPQRWGCSLPPRIMQGGVRFSKVDAYVIKHNRTLNP